MSTRGSARRNLGTGLKRHLYRHKHTHWHIDYFLAHRRARILDVKCPSTPEGTPNQWQQGDIPVPRFGVSGCCGHCGSHFKYLGAL